MTDHDAHMDLLARAAGTATACQVEDPDEGALLAPIADWLAGLLFAILAVGCIGLAVVSVVAPYVLANLKS